MPPYRGGTIAAPLPLWVICELVGAPVEDRARIFELSKTGDEFDVFFLLLTVAGNQPTRNAAAGGMLALCERPDQWQRLLDDPSLIPTAAEEIVRWVTSTCRCGSSQTAAARAATADGLPRETRPGRRSGSP